MNKKIIILIIIIFTLLFVGIYGILRLLSFCSTDDALSKDEIFNIVLGKQDSLNKAIIEINSFDKYISVVANTKFREPGGETEVQGLYTGGVKDKEYIYKSLDNKILDDLLKEGKIKYISINRIKYKNITTDKDQIDFHCGGKFMDCSYGFYYSPTGNPIGYQGDTWTFEKDGNGWLDMTDETYNYTEQIVGNWYYYEMEYSAEKRVKEKLNSMGRN